MGKRWKPPRWAKPWKPEKDPELEEVIRELEINGNRVRAEKEKEEGPEQSQESGNE